MINLQQGDCLELMKNIPDESVDMVLTDPPYGMAFQSRYRTSMYEKIKGDQNLDWLDDFVEEIFRVSKNNTAHYMFCSYHHIDIFKQAIQKRFNVKNIITWVKNNTSMGDLKGDFAPKTEFIIFFQKGRRLINGKRDSNVFEYNKTRNELHPTQKPVDMVEYMLSKFSDEGGVILDPFMGSGTTGVAATNLDRSFIGYEIDEDYFKIAEQRISEAQL
ncbi:DNA methyltransferase [Liquorilactobacillus mali]|uniref:DNA-methyltransferase n=1 Tax=Liquorilactobacillus mali TaxID=1618 RepID=UPI002655D3C7|nr:site-specific DNA-methyltransferase [Liquorilactobacillus mali]MDN7145281.1 DNA methyltransferase [Liquorilactobacillus mali]